MVYEDLGLWNDYGLCGGSSRTNKDIKHVPNSKQEMELADIVELSHAIGRQPNK